MFFSQKNNMNCDSVTEESLRPNYKSPQNLSLYWYLKFINSHYTGLINQQCVWWLRLHVFLGLIQSIVSSLETSLGWTFGGWKRMRNQANPCCRGDVMFHVRCKWWKSTLWKGFGKEVFNHNNHVNAKVDELLDIGKVVKGVWSVM